MELKAKNVPKSVNNQNVNILNINQGNENFKPTSQFNNPVITSSNLSSSFSNSQCIISSSSISSSPPINIQNNNVQLSSSQSFNSPIKLEYCENNSNCLSNSLNDSFDNNSFKSNLLNNSSESDNNAQIANLHLSNDSNENLQNSETELNDTNLNSVEQNFFQNSTIDNNEEQLNEFTDFSTDLNKNESNNYFTTNHQQNKLIEICATCSNQITDRFIMKLNGHSYHEKCLLCCCCGSSLYNVCYHKNSKLYCKLDYLRLFSKKCDACNDVILPNDLVMKVHSDAIFHLKCFACFSCKLPLKTGDQFGFNNGLLLCKQHLQNDLIKLKKNSNQLILSSSINSTLIDPIFCHQQLVSQLATNISSNFNPLETSNHPSHLQAQNTLCNITDSHLNLPMNNEQLGIPSIASKSINNVFNTNVHLMKNQSNGQCQENMMKEEKPFIRSRSDGRRGPKRPRTILTTPQRRAFKNSFEMSQKPCRKVREGLAKETGLSVRIVQVWFQNQRAKLKKLQRKQTQQNHHSNNVSRNLQHLQTPSSFLNDESQLSDLSEDFEHYQFGNSPEDSSYYSPNDYSKSIIGNGEENSDIEDENIQEDDENCLNQKKILATCNKTNSKSNGKKITNLPNTNSTSDSNSFEFSSNNNINLFSVSNVNFTNAISDISNLSETPPIGVAVAQAITSSTNVLSTSCSNLPTTKSNNNQTKNSTNIFNTITNSFSCNKLETSTNPNSKNIEFNTKNTMSPIDKLYSMQNSYFNNSTDCETCITTS